MASVEGYFHNGLQTTDWYGDKTRPNISHVMYASFEAVGGLFVPPQLPPSPVVAIPTKTPRPPGRPERLETELGIDVACILDADSTWSLVSGKANLARALARRLSTPRGGLFYAPDYGLDVRLYLHADLGAAELANLGPAIEDECEKDERVESCSADVSYSFETRVLTIKLAVTTAEGPFELILAVSQLTVEVLGATGL